MKASRRAAGENVARLRPARDRAADLFEELPRDGSLTEPLDDSPFGILARWLDEASEQRVQPNPTAMALATVGGDGRPSLRMLLCRGLDPVAGAIVFYTNRESRKGRELWARPHAAATFHWDAWQRQARLEGRVSTLSDEESDTYFAGRPRLAQLSAWASAQSRPVASRAALLEQLRAVEERFGPEEMPVPRPPHWGGYRLVADRVELWVGSTGRAHDRVQWEREGSGWRPTRLQP